MLIFYFYLIYKNIPIDLRFVFFITYIDLIKNTNISMLWMYIVLSTLAFLMDAQENEDNVKEQFRGSETHQKTD